VGLVLVATAGLDEWSTVRTMSRSPGIVGALGLHPFHLDERPRFRASALREACRPGDGTRIAAIGEIGLDYWEGRRNREEQLGLFTEQLTLAADLGLPVILHTRKAWDDFLSCWRGLERRPSGGVCHHFTGSRELARQLLDLGLCLSFCGPVTYAQAVRIRDVATYVPADRLLTETDCPDLPPAGIDKGASRPWHVRRVVETLAELRGTTVEDLVRQVWANAVRLLGRDVLVPVSSSPAEPAADAVGGDPAAVRSRAEQGG
jgi:TatD DNase family protein